MTDNAPDPRHPVQRAFDLTDRLELLELYARYTHAFDRADAAACAALFTADGVFTPPGAAPVIGRPALEQFFAVATARSHGSSHMVTDVLIDAEHPGVARGTARVLAVRTEESVLRLLALGIYRDIFRYDGRRWLFGKRTIDSAVPAALSGAVLATANWPAP
ncbi:nuclear transport factor 2 family protein [Nocardia sp. NPDC004860]|uniref:nuclear transport factor 2 family protein n=1 Tax=Nocardia sp. NPDC004860 TaxID=3154557 RepID=UPI0033B670E5